MKVSTRTMNRAERQRAVGLIPNQQRAMGLIPSVPRSGFTLTELLVVMVILVILTTMTVWTVNFTLSSERSRAAARQVQSYLEGARDRAIYEKRPVGVRFLVDDNIPNSISSMVYIEESEFPAGPAEVHKTVAGTSYLLNVINENTGETVGLDWARFRQRGLLRVVDRVRIPANADGFEYTIQNLYQWVDPMDPMMTTRERIDFEPEFRDDAATVDRIEQVELFLPPVIRPDQEPMLLPRGIVIDGNGSRSKLPATWTLGSGRLDIMFSPRGTVSGRAASSGLVHFYLAEAADVERLNVLSINVIPSDTPYGTAPDDDLIGDRLLVTLFPQTGAISSHPVDPTPLIGDPRLAVDPYRFAETGEVAGE